ncbi:MAG TPA: cytochrome c3 family protein [Vicinamibacterales bacterium]|nr:cytochrome c3 family protein [Vicinamibacterales bacterium]
MKKPRDVTPGTPAPSQRTCDRVGDVVDFDGQRVATGPCADRAGNPVAHTAYVSPAPHRSALGLSLAGAGVLAAVLVTLFFTGAPARPNGPRMPLRTAMAPGPTSSPHSMATTDCIQCHRPSDNVEDVRCERCHDPAVSARLTNAAHVFGTTGDIRAAMAAPAVECVTCHVEHRGAGVNLADVDDRECGTCHRSSPGSWKKLTTLGSHPEFAVVRAGVESGSGLRWFNHAMHLEKVQQKSQRGCDGCHEGGATDPAFRPISFVRHCAGCHNEDLSQSAGSLTPAMIAALAPLRPGVRIESDPDDPDRQRLAGFTHADPWILRSVQSLRRVASPAGVAAERLALDRQVAQLELVMRFAPGAASPGGWLDPERSQPADAAAAAPRPPETALRELATAVEALAATFGAEGQELANEAVRLKNAPASERPPQAAASTDVAPLRRMIEATAARARAAGDSGLEARAKALLDRLDKLPAGDRTPAATDAASTGLEILLAEMTKVRDPGSRADLREMTDLARLAQHKAAGGIDPTAFDQHREQMLLLLDAVRDSLVRQARAGADPRVSALLAREDSLRRLVLATSYSLPPDLSASLGRFFRARQAERARVDLELEAAELRVRAPREKHGVPAGLADRLAQLQNHLAAAGSAPQPPSSLSAPDARAAITALLGTVAPDAEANALSKNRCTLCHELTPEGDQLAPVRSVGESLLPSARFTHVPHVSSGAENCETCHSGIRTSAAARDVNLPGVDFCRTCHAPGRQAARASGCESCHSYHVPSFSALRWRP